jgi:hypothetical protein
MNCDLCQDDFNSVELRNLDVVVFNHPGLVQKALLLLRPDSEEELVYQDREIHVCERCYYAQVQPLMEYFQRSERMRALIGVFLAVPIGVGLYFLGTSWFEYGLLPIFCGAVAGKLYHDFTGTYYKKRILRALDVADIKSIGTGD